MYQVFIHLQTRLSVNVTHKPLLLSSFYVFSFVLSLNSWNSFYINFLFLWLCLLSFLQNLHNLGDQ